jgi:hypothetical protein
MKECNEDFHFEEKKYFCNQNFYIEVLTKFSVIEGNKKELVWYENNEEARQNEDFQDVYEERT